MTIDITALSTVLPNFRLLHFAETFPHEFRAAEQRCGDPLLKSGPGYLDAIYSVCESIQATRVIETGVAYGWSSFALLMSLRVRVGAHLVSVDRPYPGLSQDIVGLAVPASLRDRWTLYRESDRRGVPMAIRDLPEVDLVHYDSDKTYAGHRRTLPMLWAAVRSGGVLMCDDAGDNSGFLDFCSEASVTPTVVKRKGKHVGILVKP